ncbi:hypothetical protein FI667_g7313, partial [Globisporangium splendens]
MYGRGNDNPQHQRSSNLYQDYSQAGKQPSGYDDGNTLYPSFANQQQQQQSASSSAPFTNQSNNGHQDLPLYYNSAPPPDTRVQGSHYGGYPTHPPPPVYQPVAPYTPSPYSGDYRSQGCISTTLKLIIFHFFNAVLAISGFVLIISCTSISIGLIPLCCLGIVLLRAMFYIVGYLAKFDVKLYNFISPPSEHVYVGIPQEARFFDIVGERLSPKLFEFSPLSITAALYFGTIKYAVGVLSAIVVVMNVGLVIGLIAAMSYDDSVSQYGELQINNETVDFSEHPLQYALIWVCLYVISIALMHLVARISRASTRFFCCEKFSTYRYVQTVQYTPPVNASSYGTY